MAPTSSALFVALGAIGCVDVAPFVCAGDDQCADRGTRQGRCEADHRCSLADELCPSGFRYAEVDGRGACVAPAPAADGSASDGPTDASERCPPQTLRRWTFEQGPQGWSAAPLAEDEPAPWLLADTMNPRCHEGVRCWAQAANGDYPTCASGILTSPQVDLSACADADVELVFFHHWSFEAHDDGPAPDGGFVELSNGASWQNAVPGVDEAYVATIWTSRMCPVERITLRYRDNLGWAGVGRPGWREVRVPILPFFRSSAFQARFVFGSDARGTARGWLIDDVRIVVNP